MASADDLYERALDAAVDVGPRRHSDEAIRLLRSALRADPLHVDAISLLGSQLVRAGSLAAAIDHYERGLNSLRSDRPADEFPRLAKKVCQGLADAYIRAERHVDAIPLLDEIMVHTPNLDSAVSLAECLNAVGQSAAALDLLDPLIAQGLRSYVPGLLLQAARALRRLGEPEQAAELLGVLLQQLPTDEGALVELDALGLKLAVEKGAMYLLPKEESTARTPHRPGPPERFGETGPRPSCSESAGSARELPGSGEWHREEALPDCPYVGTVLAVVEVGKNAFGGKRTEHKPLFTIKADWRVYSPTHSRVGYVDRVGGIHMKTFVSVINRQLLDSAHFADYKIQGESVYKHGVRIGYLRRAWSF